MGTEAASGAFHESLVQRLRGGICRTDRDLLCGLLRGRAAARAVSLEKA